MVWAGPLNHRLARFIVSSGELFGLRRRGAVIEGFCREISDPPWRAKAEVRSRKIRGASCSCAQGEKGRCPHVAAILLAYESNPERFLASHADNAPLENQSKSELIENIRQMRAQAAGSEHQTRLEAGYRHQGNDLPTLRRHASIAFMVSDQDYETAVHVAADLERSLRRGDRHLAQREFRKAIVAHAAVALAILDYSEVVTILVDRDDGELRAALGGAITGLASGLAGAEPEDSIRKLALGTLFCVHLEDLNYGGCMFGERAGTLIAEHASTTERALLTSWVRAGMPTGLEWPDHIQRQLRGRFLLELGHMDLDEEAVLGICREAGLAAELADRLLPVGRLDEVISEFGICSGIGSARNRGRLPAPRVRGPDPPVAGQTVRFAPVSRISRMAQARAP